MTLQMLKGKIHRATVIQAALDYVGSITIDEDLLDAAGILETYTIAGERGSGMICLNGAAARCASVKDKVIIMSYADMTPEEAKVHRPSVVFVDEINRIDRVTNYEKHGQLFDKARLDEE